MLDIKTIDKEIKKLEECNMSYATCEKLAALYTIKDHYAEAPLMALQAEPNAPSMTTPK